MHSHALRFTYSHTHSRNVSGCGRGCVCVCVCDMTIWLVRVANRDGVYSARSAFPCVLHLFIARRRQACMLRSHTQTLPGSCSSSVLLSFLLSYTLFPPSPFPSRQLPSSSSILSVLMSPPQSLFTAIGHGHPMGVIHPERLTRETCCLPHSMLRR